MLGIKDKIKAIFFDIDGTLVSFTTHTVPESARRAIARLRERGVKVFIATGRLLRHTEVVSDIEVDGYITVNGSYCLTASGDVIFEQSFPQDVVARIFALEKEYGFRAAVMTHENIFVDSLSGRPEEVADMVHITPVEADLDEIVATQPVLQMCPYISKELEQKIMPLLPECVSSRWVDMFMDLNLKGIDKSVAARRVMEYYGYTIDEAMAFGDGGNDVPIVRDVGVGVAMGNACEELKSVADYVAASVDEDGIERALLHFGLI